MIEEQQILPLQPAVNSENNEDIHTAVTTTSVEAAPTTVSSWATTNPKAKPTLRGSQKPSFTTLTTSWTGPDVSEALQTADQ